MRKMALLLLLLSGYVLIGMISGYRIGKDRADKWYAFHPNVVLQGTVVGFQQANADIMVKCIAGCGLNIPGKKTYCTQRLPDGIELHWVEDTETCHIFQEKK